MLFTVCTATFNRAHTLHRVFDSLKAQTFQDFEWLVIDDGSADDTRTLVARFKDSATFPIRYEFQENLGKHVAVNHGAKLARGEFFIIADSDDAFPSDAFEIFLDSWNSIPQTQRAEFTGVTGLCANDIDGAVIGDRFPEDVFDTTSSDLFYRHDIGGEKWGFHRTSVIRNHPFPVREGTRFIAESLVWNKIAKKYKTRFINRVVRIYSQNSTDQLTRRPMHERGKDSFSYIMTLKEDADFLFVAPLKLTKISIQAVRLSLHGSECLFCRFPEFDNISTKLLWMMTIPVGLLLWILDCVAKR